MSKIEYIIGQLTQKGRICINKTTYEIDTQEKTIPWQINWSLLKCPSFLQRHQQGQTSYSMQLFFFFFKDFIIQFKVSEKVEGQRGRETVYLIHSANGHSAQCGISCRSSVWVSQVRVFGSPSTVFPGSRIRSKVLGFEPQAIWDAIAPTRQLNQLQNSRNLDIGEDCFQLFFFLQFFQWPYILY